MKRIAMVLIDHGYTKKISRELGLRSYLLSASCLAGRVLISEMATLFLQSRRNIKIPSHIVEIEVDKAKETKYLKLAFIVVSSVAKK
jgi:hypothetical protein